MKQRAIMLLVLAGLLTGAILAGLRVNTALPADPDHQALLLRLAGPFRVFLADAIWLRMRSHLSNGEEAQVLADARTLLALHPDSQQIRYFLHWHLVFNMAHRAASDRSRRVWINEGFDILEEGLDRNPDGAILNRGLGMTFYMRSTGSEFFRRLCEERFGRPPVALAPLYFQKAYEKLPDRITLLYYMSALLDAATYAMEDKQYQAAAEQWQAVLGLTAPWLAARGAGQDQQDLERYYRDLADYCLLLAEMKKKGTIPEEDVKRMKTLEQRIHSNPFFDLGDDQD